MGLDIFAAQRLVGAPTSTMFAGGQTYGFNSDIKYTAIDGNQQSLTMYDFAVNTNPIVTLYNYGTGNKLDLSGYSTSSTINLNDGTFSSANGMKNNIFIEYGTAINSVTGGSGDDSFTVNSGSDIIDGGGGTNTAVFSATRASYAAAFNNNIYTLTSGAVSYSLTNIQTVTFSDQTVAAAALVCFLRGTLIATPSGDIAVENLRAGDLLLTASGAIRPIVWLGFGRSLISPRNRCDASPVIFRAGALGADAAGLPTPRRDLFVTRRHAMLVDGVLVAAEHLVNGASVVWDMAARVVEFYHIELGSHDVILAEGAASESYRDDNSLHLFHNTSSRPARTPEPACRPIVDAGPALDSAWRSVAQRAAPLPAATFSPNADMHLLVDDRRIDGRTLDGEFWHFDLPRGARSITIASHSVIPAIDGENSDLRRLGVAVEEITLLRHNLGRMVDLASGTLVDGWHTPQYGHRWTKGLAVLPSQICSWFGGATHLTIRVRPAAQYRRMIAAA